MYENKFDEALDEISTTTGVEWNADSKLRVMARFLSSRHPELYAEFEQFVNQQAENENLDSVVESDEDGDA